MYHPRGGTNMTAVTKPINRMTTIKTRESAEFIKKFNKNKVSQEFLEFYKKAGKLLSIK